MSRRKNASAKTGYVNFPVEDQDGFKNSNLGGMYVQLVAIENRSDREDWWEDAFLDCFGGSNTTLEYQETMAGTDSLVDGKVPYTQEMDETWDEEVSKLAYATKLVFPHFFDSQVEKGKRYRSKAILASVILGSSGGTWERNGDYWRCSFEDLDIDGQELVDLMRKLYGSKAELHLITWVDEG